MQNSQSYEFLNVGGFWPKASDLLHLVTTYFKIGISKFEQLQNYTFKCISGQITAQI